MGPYMQLALITSERGDLADVVSSAGKWRLASNHEERVESRL